MYQSWLKNRALIIVLILLFPTQGLGISPERGLKILNILKDENLPLIRRMVEPYVGTVKFTWGGESVIGGMDCSGFSRFIIRKLGVQLPRTVKEQARVGYRVSWLMPGDLVFFDSTRRRPGLDHVGIFVGNGEFVHSSKPKGVVIEELAKYKYSIGDARRVL
jgi:NlpC/P60 family protein